MPLRDPRMPTTALINADRLNPQDRTELGAISANYPPILNPRKQGKLVCRRAKNAHAGQGSNLRTKPEYSLFSARSGLRFFLLFPIRIAGFARAPKRKMSSADRF